MRDSRVFHHDLEIGLHPGSGRPEPAGRYHIELRFTQPDNETRMAPERGTATLDLPALRDLRDDPRDVGGTLADALFHDDNVRNLYTRARRAAAARPLRLRLALPTDARELQELPWELLHDPETGIPVATVENVYFSRFLRSRDWRGIELRPRRRLKTLIAVASPSSLARYRLADIDAEAEVQRVRESLDPPDRKSSGQSEDLELTIAGRDEPLTLPYLTERLRADVDVLYLVCHSLMSRKQEPSFFLQDDSGEVAHIQAGQLALAIAELPTPPRLVVLDTGSGDTRAMGSTGTAGTGTAEAVLAPLLAESGVSAIVTLPSLSTATTATAFIKVFFRELHTDGQVDRAMAVARAAVLADGHDPADACLPALYLRLRRGCLWRQPARRSVFVCSTSEELAPFQTAACDVVRELGMDPLRRRTGGLPGFEPVAACQQQTADADFVIAILGHRRGDVPGAESGGDGAHPWEWWETRAAFEQGRPVAVLMTADSRRPRAQEEDLKDGDEPDARDVMRDFRGELHRLATFFEEDAHEESFREKVRRQLRQFLSIEEAPAATSSADPDVVLRRWPPPRLPERPYPVLLPYTHPDLMAGRDLELDKLRQLLTGPVPILGLHAPSGSGKSSLLAAGLVPGLRADGRPMAFDRHPTEPGIAQRLLSDLLATDGDDVRGNGSEETLEIADDEPIAFVDRLQAVRRVASIQPLLVLDQFEDLLRHRDADRARAVVGTLLAASVQRRPGQSGPPCRWLLTYRQEFHGEVFRWLGDVLTDARRMGTATFDLPHDLSSADRFQAWPLAPLGTPAPATEDRVEAAARIFQAAIEKPLALTSPEGGRLYRYRFAGDSAARLARAFGEARVARRNAPLAPEFQVVLSHLLEASWQTDDDGRRIIDVPDHPGELIDRALEEHLKRSLDVAFPAGKTAETKLRRSRALLALRELADVHGRRDEGRSAAILARAIGSDGRDVLEKLATARTRVVLLERHGDKQVYVLSHDRMAEVIVRLVDEEGAYAGLGVGVDAELLGLRRFVAVQRELFTAGEVEQSTEVPKDHFSGIERHADALLWDEHGRRWWQACRERRRLDRRRKLIRGGVAATVLALSMLLAGIWADRYFKRQALLETIAEGEPEEAFAALARLTGEADAEPEELLDRVQRREQPFDVLERGLGGVEEARGAALLRVAELLLPLVGEDPVRIASTVWALDFFAGPDPPLREQAGALRDAILEPLRRRRPPPPMPAFGTPAAGDPQWADIPAGTFWMGAGPDDGRDDPNMQDEFPRHQVTLSAFRMMVHEVTNAEFRRLWPEHGNRWSDYPGEDDQPASRMTWYEAYTYAAWLGGRLPTESEWEYAARAGCAYAYCRRDGSEAALDDVAWWFGNSVDPETGETSSKPVMQLEPNPWGLWDVYGNVKEWNATWYGSYPETPEKDPPGPTDTVLDYRTNRGGFFLGPKEWVLASGRGVGQTGLTSFYADGLGLRVVIAEAEDR